MVHISEIVVQAPSVSPQSPVGYLQNKVSAHSSSASPPQVSPIANESLSAEPQAGKTTTQKRIIKRFLNMLYPSRM